MEKPLTLEAPSSQSQGLARSLTGHRTQPEEEELVVGLLTRLMMMMMMILRLPGLRRSVPVSARPP